MALACLFQFSAAIILPSIILLCGPPALASETKTDLEKIIEDVEYGRRPSALARIDDYLKVHPQDPDVLSMKGRYTLMQGKNADAERLYIRALAASPNYLRALNGLAFCQIEDHNYKGALANAAKSVALNTLDPIYVLPDPTLLKNLKVLYLKAGRAKEAEQIQQKYKMFEATELARKYREKGVLEKSLAVLDQLLKSDPDLTFARLLRGVDHNNRSDHLKAIKDFDGVIARQPSLTTAYYLRGDSYFELGNKAKAVESWRQLLKLQPPAYPKLVAFCYTAMTGRFREHFEPNDEMIVNRADVYFLCAMAESDLHHHEQALKDYTQCIALDPGEYKAYFERAAINERLNRETLVLADLEKALKLNGNYIEALLERAKIFEKKHDNARALADYSRVIAVNPGDFGSYILRADLASRIKNYAQALADYSQAIKLSPSDDDPLIGRAKVYTSLGRYDDALADYHKAIRLNSQDKGVVMDAIAHVEKLKKGPAVSVR